MTSEPPLTVHRLRRLTVLLQGAAETFAKGDGLSANDVRALIALLDRERAGDAASPTWLAAELGLTTASTTVLLDRLQAAGHVRRRPRGDDRRRVDLTVEPSAKALGWSFFGPLIEATERVLGSRDGHEREVVDAFLDDMVAAVSASAPGGAAPAGKNSGASA